MFRGLSFSVNVVTVTGYQYKIKNKNDVVNRRERIHSGLQKFLKRECWLFSRFVGYYNFTTTLPKYGILKRLSRKRVQYVDLFLNRMTIIEIIPSQLILKIVQIAVFTDQ